jgi:inosine-uridine nucleoside N-ribohydrolase
MASTTTSVSTEDILSAVNAIQEEAIDFLKKIVSIESTLEKGEGTVQNIIYDHLVHVLADDDDDDDLFKIERIPVQLDKIKDQRGYSPVDWEYTDVIKSLMSLQGITIATERMLMLKEHCYYKDMWMLYQLIHPMDGHIHHFRH